MLRRMWRAFWCAMREPVERYALRRTVEIRVEVDSRDAMQRLAELTEAAERAYTVSQRIQ